MKRSHCLASAFLSLFVGTLSTAATASPSGVVISQVYGGGGNSGATYNHDFIELFNSGAVAVDISGWSVQYASSAGSSWSSQINMPAGTTLQPGHYFLIQGAGGSTGMDLPTPDASGNINMSASKGNVALVRSTTPLSGTCPTGGDIEDFVGFGTAACHEGVATAPSASTNAEATLRNGDGCADTDDNSADFAAGTINPRNSGVTEHLCGNPSDIVLSVADVSQAEGNSGSTAFNFTVHLSQPAGTGGVSFDIATADGTATIANNDYDANSVTGASIPEGDSDYTFTVLVNGDTIGEPDETFSVEVTNITGTNVVTTAANATGTIVNDDAMDAAIYTIQGNDSTQGADGASPYVGQLVHTSGIVTVLDGNSFYLQTADADADSDPTTSNGIYVFRSSPTPTVVSGDAVTLDATVSEYYGFTELGNVTNLQVVSHGNALPTPVEFNATTPSPDPTALSCGSTNFECYEGMLVQIDNGIVTQGSGHSSAHPYDYLYVTASGTRALREPGLFPGNAATAGDNDAAGHWDGNPEVFEMSPNEFAGVNDDQVPITGGSTFTATGVMGYSFGSYEFYPTALTITDAAPVPRAVPTGSPATLRIGSFNVERYCDDVDDTVPSGTDPLPPGKELTECSGGAAPPTTAEYDEKTNRLADYIATVLNLPDVVALEEVENIGVLTKLANQLQATYHVTYAPKLIEGNDIGGIDVGYLVNTARVQVFAVQQLDKDLKWHTPNGHDRAVFDHPPLLLQGIFTGAGQSEPFMVLVNHLKARQNVDKVTSTGVSTSAALEDQEKRFRQAYATALLVQDLQSSYSAQTAPFRNQVVAARGMAASSNIPLIVVGDFNAYQFTDGYADTVGMIAGTYDFAANLWDLSDLTAWNLQPITTPLADQNVVVPPLWNAVTSLPVNEQYSYLYPADFGKVQGYGIGGGGRKIPTDQVLDHALLNETAHADFVRMDYGRANEDAASQDESTSTGPIGVSDHDGFVVQLILDDVIFANGFELGD